MTINENSSRRRGGGEGPSKPALRHLRFELLTDAGSCRHGVEGDPKRNPGQHHEERGRNVGLQDEVQDIPPELKLQDQSRIISWEGKQGAGGHVGSQGRGFPAGRWTLLYGQEALCCPHLVDQERPSFSRKEMLLSSGIYGGADAPHPLPVPFSVIFSPQHVTLVSLSPTSPDCGPLGGRFSPGCGAGKSPNSKPHGPTTLQRGSPAPKGWSGEEILFRTRFFCFCTLCPTSYLSPAATWWRGWSTAGWCTAPAAGSPGPAPSRCRAASWTPRRCRHSPLRGAEPWSVQEGGDRTGPGNPTLRRPRERVWMAPSPGMSPVTPRFLTCNCSVDSGWADLWALRLPLRTVQC